MDPEKWKWLKDLSAQVLFQLIAVGLVGFLALKILPTLEQVPAMAGALSVHENNQANFYQKHLALMEENVRLARLQCVSYQEYLKRPTSLCLGGTK